MFDVRVRATVFRVEDDGTVLLNVPTQQGRSAGDTWHPVTSCQLRAKLCERMRNEGQTVVVSDDVGVLVDAEEPGARIATIIHATKYRRAAKGAR
jgi:hypothetical protein